MNFRNILFLLQVYIHAMFIFGIIGFSLKFVLPVILIAQIIFVGACGTVFFHRIVSHKNYVNPYFEKILLLLSWIGSSGSALAWAGTHRKHHRYTDTDKDPHSPEIMGIFRTYWLSSGGNDVVRYVPDLLRKPIYVFQHKYYFHFLISAHILGIIFLPFYLYWALLIVPAFLMWFAGSTINIFCHKHLKPKNIHLLGIVHAGEGWHANHHSNPASPKFNDRYDWGNIIYRVVSYRKFL